MSDLLPCPFCGGAPRVSTYETESLWSHDQVTYTQVSCPECEISFHSEPGYEVEAPAAWNRRAPLTEAHPTPGGDGCYCTHHPDDPSHGPGCYDATLSGSNGK